MKRIKSIFSMRLRTRMLVVILGSIVILLAGMLTAIALITNSTSMKSAISLTETAGEKIAANVQNNLDKSMGTARTLAHSFEVMKKKGNTDRETVNTIIKNVLEKNESYLAAWTIWEPNAFDGKDQQYKNTAGTDQSGRLLPYWKRTDTGLKLSPLEAYEEDGVGDYYLKVKNSGVEAIIEPYKEKFDDKDVIMTSLVVPIKENNEVIGAVGIDIDLEILQKMMDPFKLYDTGYAHIYSNTGIIVTLPDQSQIGKNLKDAFPSERVPDILAAISEGNTLTYNDNGTYLMYTPIQIGNTDTPWSVTIVIPMKEIMADSQALMYYIIAAGVITLVLLGLVIMFLTNTIVRPLNRAVIVGESMARGDFTQELPEEYRHRKDEIGTFARVFHDITESMTNMIGQVNMNASQVAAASQQISASAEELAVGSSQQADSVQTINELFKELSFAINAVASSATSAAELVNQTAGIASQGGTVVQQSIEGMNRVNRQVLKLEDDSTRIGEIIEVIDDIAEQTNLLALNAAIEAARAGEQGRGFAVVADEVRKLAERSGEATKQIATIIKGMQNNTVESVKAVEAGVISTEKTGESFDHIISMVNDSSNTVMEIAAASEEQAAQAAEVVTAIESISASAEETAASSEETASTAQSLAELAEELNNMVAAFKIK
ncbi:methyl-accepting chemotaxis protein [Paenibacillus sp. N3/727]|uniref:methyl-accepting chemotaxis protein n=1 Tax=Paenibacillus sp. N3/727 TaxID=2925845 RepID=UPI001F536A29|nr:methyl-accepting chemotaxis protein [Paenibacillus sp. N3/727]UNK19674.1 methyl-accepting chemotaxis protein [Paenibacillus sp. N3/727]